ncbi:MAG: aminopeptidase [Gaiellaceae bacterium]
MIDERLERYAELAVRVGSNLAPGQVLNVWCSVEHAPLARAIARAAYAAGARYVDVFYTDQHVRREMIANADEETLSWTPPWLLERTRTLGDGHGALIAITGDPEPELLSDLDGARVGKARMVALAEENLRQLNERLVNWSIVAYPNEGWAKTVFGEPDVERLWGALVKAARLDEADPVAAWHDHMDRLVGRANGLNERTFDAIRFTGPGTDLTVGLLPESIWKAAAFETSWGRRHIPNMPTEEVYTTPDYRRTEGIVRSTKPLGLFGTVVRDLEMRFEAGRIVEVNATSGADAIRGQLEGDEQAPFLGEVALVDGTSRVGQTDLVFFDTLFDENATCHIAYGAAIVQNVEGAEGWSSEERLARGVNHATIHTDFMIGGPEVDVDGLDADGTVTPLLRGDVWQLS